jgi:glucose/arabinose dehydrogenase
MKSVASQETPTRRRPDDVARLWGRHARAGAALVLAGCGTNGPTQGGGGVTQPDVVAETVATGLAAPVHLAALPNDGRLFVVEQAGRIRVIEGGQVLERPFLDIRDRVRSGGERGLLSVAFHPDFAANGRFFVDYTDTTDSTRIEEYAVTVDPNVADPTSGRTLLTIRQPYGNHNGGLIAFGPQGNLWIGMGDGGSGGDPLGNGQNPATLLGAMLRIDVDGGEPYGIPSDNPFADKVDGAPEVWSYGLRNPWRYSFDGSHVYIADVGQSGWEEVNIAPTDEPGLNYGWSIMEGDHCYRAQSCNETGLERPIYEYSHDAGCSITGGYVYRGSALPDLRGHYFYGDYCQGWVRSFRYDSGGATDHRSYDLGDLGRIVSFGSDAAGEVYVLTGSGAVYRLAPNR